MIAKNLAAVLAALGLAVVPAGCSTGGQSDTVPVSSSSCPSHTTSDRYVGFSVPEFPPSPANLTALRQATGIDPTAVSMYISLGSKLDMAAVMSICAQGALPLVEIDSDQAPLSEIASGSADGVLAGYAKSLASLHSPVAVDFDHEFNGSWNAWGFKRQSPADFIAAWQHVVTVFRQNGAANVIWVWNPAVFLSGTSSDLRSWYPGDAYVTWVGLDGYFTGPESTFSTVFNPALHVVREFTHHQVFIVETGANPASGRVRAIRSLFAGLAETPSVLGFIWFDYDKYVGHDWTINDDAAALSAFRAGARQYMSSG